MNETPIRAKSSLRLGEPDASTTGRLCAPVLFSIFHIIRFSIDATVYHTHNAFVKRIHGIVKYALGKKFEESFSGGTKTNAFVTAI